MNRVKSNAVFPAVEIMGLIARWKAVEEAEKRLTLTAAQAGLSTTAKRQLMDRIAQKSTPLFIAFALGEHHPTPLKFAEMCRQRVPKWVATLELEKAHQVFMYFSIYTCSAMRQIQLEEARLESSASS